MSSTTSGREGPISPPAPGTAAPDFRLPCSPDQTVALSALRGRPVVLAFYPGDWRSVCGGQLAAYQEYLPAIERHGAALLGISVDSASCHQAFARDRGIDFPLLADFEPKGEVARSYGVYRAADGTSERALFLIDEGGIVRWSHLSPVAVDPGVDGILTALECLEASRPP